jgi:hypothetical protein
MNKKSFIANTGINKDITIGMNVNLIDGSSLTRINNTKGRDYYIVYNYPEVCSHGTILSEVDFKVVGVNITTSYSSGAVNNIYLQDLIIEKNGIQFRTSSRMVKESEKKYIKDTFKRGDRFRGHDGDIYLLTQVGTSLMTMISLKFGNRYQEPIKVGSTLKVTAYEVSDMMSNRIKPKNIKSCRIR